MKNVLQFDSLELSYGDKKILSSIFMRCEQGEIVGLLGRNGSGKSSLMKIVFGSLHADYRHVRINDIPVTKSFCKDIVYLSQDTLIPTYLTIRQAFKLFKIDCDEVAEVYPAITEQLSMQPSALSGGSLRLIEALLIIFSKAKFCILDEPFSGLMPVHVDMLVNVLNRKKQSKGFIITDHLYRQVSSISDRLYLLANGKTYEIKTQEQLVSLGYLNAL